MKEKLEELTREDLEAVRRYRVRSGILTAIAVAMYIVCWLPMVFCGLIAENAGANVELWGGVGLAVMMLIIAVATAILIINSYLRPICLKDNKIVFVGSEDPDGDDDENEKASDDKSVVRTAIHGAVWMIAVVGFLCLGFIKELWHPGWIVFIIAVAVNKVSDVIFEIVKKKSSKKENKQ